MPVAITREDLSAADLRQAAARTQEAKVARRMLAIALVLEGGSRAEAAETCAMDRQTLRDRVHRYNASGLEGLSDQPRRNGRWRACRRRSRPRWRSGLTKVPI
jgi:transposase